MKIDARRVADVSAKTLRGVLKKHADPRSSLHTDESLTYEHVGKDFAEHEFSRQYFKDGIGVESAEAFFAILKRGVYSTFHNISEKHLHRYCNEFAFRWNTRSKLGIEDAERARILIRGAPGKRLTYRIPDKGDTLAS